MSGRAPLSLRARPAKQPDFGGLEFRAGFVLTGGDPRFGGLSGLWLAPDGERLIALSDRGTLWLAEPEHADDGTLIGFAGWQRHRARRAPGDPTGARRRGARRSWRRSGDRVRGRASAAPRPARGAPSPRRRAADSAGAVRAAQPGIEALVGLAGGALLAIAEGVRTPSGDLAAWLIEDDRDRVAQLCAGRRLCADRRRSAGRHDLCPRAAACPARRPRRARGRCWMRRRSGPAPGWSAASSPSCARRRSARTSRASRRAARPMAGCCSICCPTTTSPRCCAACCCSSRYFIAFFRTVLLQFTLRINASQLVSR